VKSFAKNLSQHNLRRWGVDLLLLAMFVLTTYLYALLMVRDRVPIPGLIALVALGLAHWTLAGRRNPTPLDLPILWLLTLLPLNLAVSIDRGMTLTKVTGALLGVALFYLMAQFVTNRDRLHLALLALLVLALGLAGLGLVGTDWSSTKVFALPQVYNALPSLVESVPRSRAGGIQSNLMGGALAFLAPFLFSLLWDRGRFDLARVLKLEGSLRPLKIAYKVLVVLALLTVSFTLLLTQSRAALLGALVGALAAAIWHERRFLWALPALLVNALLAWRFIGADTLAGFFTSIDAREGITLPLRGEFWARGLRLVQDFPFTGTGIGTYSALVRMFYPFSTASSATIASTDLLMTHAHNQVITMATDLGLPGLVLYAALFGGFAAMVAYTWRYADRLAQAVLVGLTCGLLAHQVFGVMDAFMLGSKLAALLWIFLGLGAALYVHRWHIAGPRRAPKRVIRSFWKQLISWLLLLVQGLAGWVFFSLLAVAFVHTNTIVSLALAVMGGAALGVLLVVVYEAAFYEKGVS